MRLAQVGFCVAAFVVSTWEVSATSSISGVTEHSAHRLAVTHLRQTGHTLDPQAKTGEKDAPPLMVDSFMIIYWGAVLVVSAALIVTVSFGKVCCLRKQSVISHCIQNADGVYENEVELPRNMFALTLVTAVDQAKACGVYHIPAPVTWLVSVAMGGLQLFVIFLIVHDIEPNAKPVTEVPPLHTPWIKQENLWTVHCIKWIMVSFLIFAMVAEVGQAKDVFEVALTLHRSRMSVPRIFPIMAVFTQYFVVIGIIWGGVCAVMSLQDVPNIIYSSMSITFIGNIDEMFWEFFQQVFDIEADFTIKRYIKDPEKPDAIDVDAPENDKDILPHQLPDWLKVLMKVLEVFPMLMGFALIGRAWHTNIMPSDRLHIWLAWVMGLP